METNTLAESPTAGPWFVSNGTFEQAHICGHEDVLIAIVSKQDPQCDGGRCTATERANARLIATAPELLAALEKLCSDAEQAAYQLTRHGERTRAEALDERIEQARAIIAKATH